MRIVIQRVLSASVTTESIKKAEIEKGLLILLGIEESDKEEDIKWLINKIVNLRIFDDTNGVMNLSIKDINGDLLLVSQFTLFASTKKGNRPSYIKAARPETAIILYDLFCSELKTAIGKEIEKGVFGADMKVELINDGPVTLIIDSKQRG